MMMINTNYNNNCDDYDNDSGYNAAVYGTKIIPWFGRFIIIEVIDCFISDTPIIYLDRTSIDYFDLKLSNSC